MIEFMLERSSRPFSRCTTRVLTRRASICRNAGEQSVTQAAVVGERNTAHPQVDSA